MSALRQTQYQRPSPPRIRSGDVTPGESLPSEALRAASTGSTLPKKLAVTFITSGLVRPQGTRPT